jgi:hypothetical protein
VNAAFTSSSAFCIDAAARTVMCSPCSDGGEMAKNAAVSGTTTGIMSETSPTGRSRSNCTRASGSRIVIASFPLLTTRARRELSGNHLKQPRAFPERATALGPKAERLRTSTSLPLYPRKPTLANRAAISELCQTSCALHVDPPENVISESTGGARDPRFQHSPLLRRISRGFAARELRRPLLPPKQRAPRH